MYTNKVGCTVYEKTVANRMEVYARHFIPAVYWEDTTAQVQTNTSMKQQDMVCCIIPASSISDYIPKKDDIIVCGRYEGENPPKHGRIIMTVEDFRYGSPNVQHLELTAQ